MVVEANISRLLTNLIDDIVRDPIFNIKMNGNFPRKHYPRFIRKLTTIYELNLKKEVFY